MKVLLLVIDNQNFMKFAKFGLLIKRKLKILLKRINYMVIIKTIKI